MNDKGDCFAHLAKFRVPLLMNCVYFSHSFVNASKCDIVGCSPVTTSTILVDGPY